jgi:hypothetical protein
LANVLSVDKIVISSEAKPTGERIVERKTIVYETRVDPTVVKVAGEKLKTQLFARFGFVKPRPEEVKLVSVDKRYEAYMVVSGKYMIDYYRKCAYTVRIDKKVLEIILLKQILKPVQPKDSHVKDHNLLRLEGEERLRNEVKTSLVLDASGQEVTSGKLPSAPSERNPRKVLSKFGVKEIASDADLGTIRSKIVRRPTDVSRIVSELFEVSERALIYTPRYAVRYRCLRTGEEKTVEFDAVTGERLQHLSPLPMFLAKLV